MTEVKAKSHLKPLEQADLGKSKITSPFWKKNIKRMTEKWLPHCIEELESVGYGINAFKQAANKLGGEEYTVPSPLGPWDSAYTYNTIEAICLALTIDPAGDQELENAQNTLKEKMEEWIPIVLSAQEEDGYINPKYTLEGKTSADHWTVKTDHEGYVMGYFIEAAIAYSEMTGSTESDFYKAAVKCADLWEDTIGPSPKKFWYDGHEEMELAMVRLGRFVNKTEGEGKGDKYIRLANFLCDARGSETYYNGTGTDPKYDQNHASATEQSEAVGHSVRAAYLYTGMTDVAMETDNSAYYSAVERLWDSTVNHKMYITGGVGSEKSNEGFADNYVLPNKSYNESCASCAMVFWSNRMNMAYHDAQYIDELERQLYNVVLGAVDIDGDAFYYQNELDANWDRYSWHGCPCCVGNIPRTLLSVVKWAYAVGENELYINMLLGSEIQLNIGAVTVGVAQESDYPWKGSGKITLSPSESKQFTVKLRLPEMEETTLYSFSNTDKTYTIKINGETVDYTQENGYAVLKRTWSEGDVIELSFPMEIKVVHADDRVEADKGKVALQRGPLVYNFESFDNGDLDSLILDENSTLNAEWKENLLGGVTVITGSAQRKTAEGLESAEITAIPNYARLNRGGRSVVWIAENEETAQTLSVNIHQPSLMNDILKYQDNFYKVIGENLYEFPNFIDENGNRTVSDQWYTGVTEQGTWNSVVPNPKTKANLVLLKDKIVSFADAGTGKIYYAADDVAENGSENRNMICEGIADWRGSNWNGKNSLLSYVPIEGGKTYYFSFYAARFGGSDVPSVRYGAINSENYVDSSQNNGGMIWSGEGSVNAPDGANFIMNNNQWKKFEGVITADENADYFFFNAYWLQAADYVCVNSFTLVEIEPVDAALTAQSSLTAANSATADIAQDELGIKVDLCSSEACEGLGFDVYFFNPETEEYEFAQDIPLSSASIFNDNSNALLQIKPYKTVKAKVYGALQDEKIYASSLETSLYEEALKDISNAQNNYTAENINKVRLENANRIIAAGGIVSEGMLDKVRAQIMSAELNDGIVTVEINPALAAKGFGFLYGGGLYVGTGSDGFATNGADGNIYTKLEIDLAAKTAKLYKDASDVQEAEVVYLDAVQLEFIQEIVETDLSDDRLEVEFGSTENIM